MLPSRAAACCPRRPPSPIPLSADSIKVRGVRVHAHGELTFQLTTRQAVRDRSHRARRVPFALARASQKDAQIGVEQCCQRRSSLAHGGVGSWVAAGPMQPAPHLAHYRGVRACARRRSPVRATSHSAAPGASLSIWPARDRSCGSPPALTQAAFANGGQQLSGRQGNIHCVSVLCT